MSTLASIMGGIVSALFFFVAYRKWKLKRNTQKRDLEIFEKAKPMIEAVESGRDPDPVFGPVVRAKQAQFHRTAEVHPTPPTALLWEQYQPHCGQTKEH